jgi:hypothetical protein
MPFDFNLLVEDHFKKKGRLGWEELTAMVDRIMVEPKTSGNSLLSETSKSLSKGRRAYDMVLGQFKAPTEQAGKMDTTERRDFQKYIATNITGTTLEEKINQINMVAGGAVDEGAPISEILASLGALKMLQQTLDDFNESTAGFLFEAFLSALLEGKQVTEKVGGTLPIEDCMFFVDPKTGEPGQPVSLKLLGTKTIIEGSLENLLSFFMRPEIAAVANQKGIEYIVATKTKGKRLDIYSFTITPDNFFSWIDEKYFDFNKLADSSAAEEEIETDLMTEVSKLNDPDTITKNAGIWINNVKTHRYPMMGLSPDQDINLKWSKINRWKDAIPLPSTAASQAESVAGILLSDAGKKSFDVFKQPKFAVPGETITQLEISPELEAQFLQNENPEARMTAALELAKVGRLRRDAYLRAISDWGFDQPTEAPVHIYRYYAMLNPKTGEMKNIEIQEKLKDILAKGDTQSVIQWAQLLQVARIKAQFHIQPVTVRGRSTIYGTVNISERAIVKSLALYSDRLEELVLPIYETLNELTTHINGFYFENRPGDAFKASHDAKVLHEYTEELTAQTDKK